MRGKVWLLVGLMGCGSTGGSVPVGAHDVVGSEGGRPGALGTSPSSSSTSSPTTDSGPSTDGTTPGPTGGASTAPTGSTSGASTGGCPSGHVCIDTFPWSGSGTTTGAVGLLDGYGCAPDTDESGPEVVYQVELSEAGFLAAELYGLPSGVDVDVHILDALDPDACVDRGHWASGALLMPGTYYVVVDSWVDGAGDVKDGAYSLALNVVTRDRFAADGLDPDVLERAMWAFDGAWSEGQTDRMVYGVLDFSLPSSEPRMFIMDLVGDRMIYAVHASHGIGSQDPSDLTMADRFSNVPGSEQSSLGMAVAAETYIGSNGYSLRLDGLDPSFNDNVRSRAIVIHPAEYATPDFVATYGYLGRSQGCPAVDPAISEDLIDTLADGALLWSYYPSADFLANGRYIQDF